MKFNKLRLTVWSIGGFSALAPKPDFFIYNQLVTGGLGIQVAHEPRVLSICDACALLFLRCWKMQTYCAPSVSASDLHLSTFFRKGIHTAQTQMTQMMQVNHSRWKSLLQAPRQQLFLEAHMLNDIGWFSQVWSVQRHSHWWNCSLEALTGRWNIMEQRNAVASWERWHCFSRVFDVSSQI